jgi:hypothetical protein
MLSEHRTILLSLFDSLQRLRADPYRRAREAWAIQNSLIEQILAAEGRIRNAKQLTAALRRQLSSPQPVRPSKDQARVVKEAIASHHEAVEAERRLIEIFRDVGDGLAFIYIDKWDIKPMAFKESPGFVSGKDGLSAELAIVGRAFDSGGIAVLNDLTNCLRYGDVTLIRDGEVTIVEAKSGRTLNQRGKRQSAANEKICEYLQTDRVIGLYGLEQEAHRVDLSHPELTHALALQVMIGEALARGRCYRPVEPGLHYIVDADEDIHGIMPALEAINGKAQVCMVNMLKGNNTAYYPFTLSIANPEHLYAFYNGDFVITIAVDLDYVSQYFKSRGSTVSFYHDGPWFLTVDKDEPSANQLSGLNISAHMWDRVFAEFVSLGWLLNEIASKYAGINARAKSDGGRPA